MGGTSHHFPSLFDVVSTRMFRAQNGGGVGRDCDCIHVTEEGYLTRRPWQRPQDRAARTDRVCSITCHMTVNNLHSSCVQSGGLPVLVLTAKCLTLNLKNFTSWSRFSPDTNFLWNMAARTHGSPEVLDCGRGTFKGPHFTFQFKAEAGQPFVGSRLHECACAGRRWRAWCMGRE